MVKYVLTLEYERERGRGEKMKRMFKLKENKKTCNFPLGRDGLVSKFDDYNQF